MQDAKDYDLIVKIFEKYMEHKKTKVLSEVGFKKYLLAEQAFPAWLVKNMMRQIKMDTNLNFHIHTYLEAYLVEGMMLGTIKDTAAKLVLKNKYAYEENPVALIEEKGKSVKTIRMIPAVKAS